MKYSQINLVPPFYEGEVLVSADDLRRMPEVDREAMIPSLASALRQHMEHHGFPLPPLPCSLREAVQALRDGKRTKASLYLKAVFPSYWSAGDGPAVSFLRPGVLEKALRYRVGLNSTGEVFDVTLAEMRRTAEVQRRTVSFFSPRKAYRIYRKLLAGKDRPLVWDPSGGFGGRLLGFQAAFPQGWYFANEPAKATHSDLERLSRYFGNCSIERSGSEKGHPSGIEPKALDLVFTSPPYFDKERYFDEPGQCWRDFPREEAWVENYVLPTLAYARTYLKPTAHLSLVVDNIDLWHKAARSQGFVLLDSAPLEARKDHFIRAASPTASGAKEYFAVWRLKNA